MSVANFPMVIERGTTYQNTFQWFGGGKFTGTIEDMVTGYPTRIKITGHGLNAVSSTPVILSGIDAENEDGDPREMRNINSKFNDIGYAQREDDNWFSIPLATTNETWVAGTGEMAYFRPTDISGWGGECNIRKNWHSPVLHTISTELGTMVLTGVDGSCAMTIASDITDTIELELGQYDIDLWPGGGPRPTNGDTIYRIFRGLVYANRDI